MRLTIRIPALLFLACCLTFAKATADDTVNGVAVKKGDLATTTSRDQLLQQNLQGDRESPLARWLGGELEIDDRWVTISRAEQQWAADQRLADYRHRREQSDETYRDQLRLARWCHEQGLQRQAWSHALRAAQLAPQQVDLAALRRLGLQPDGQLPPGRHELDELERLAEEVERGNRFWNNRIASLRQKLRSRSAQQQRHAREVLLAIDDVFALPSLEAFFSHEQMSEAMLLIEVMGQIDSPQSADFLLRQAVLSRWDVVRESAATQLRQHPPEAWAPAVLSALETPLQYQIFIMPSKRAPRISLVAANENQQHKSVGALSIESLLVPVVSRRNTRFADGSTESGQIGRDRAFAHGLVGAQAKSAQRMNQLERHATDANHIITERNARLCKLLRDGTGLTIPNDPQLWWQWWEGYNDVASDYKPTVHPHHTHIDVGIVHLPTTVSCLVAGTLISTDQGLLPVEQLQRGDLVLSQSPTTGELAYQPVLSTTRRQRADTFQVAYGDESFTASGGHRFWVIDRGWVMTKDLKPGDVLHTADGQVAIEAIQAAGAAKVYNLVVGAFNNYFVGHSRLLSHDVTIPVPLDQKVPGQRLVFHQGEAADQR